MITQIGISVIVPIFIGAFLGYQLDQWLETSFLFLVFLAFGIAAAFRNIYKLTKPFYAADLKREQAEQAYWDSLKKARGEAGAPDAVGDVTPDMPPGSPQGIDREEQPEVPERTSPPQAQGSTERRRRAQLCKERAAQAGTEAHKSRREMAEEEFAAWRRKKEKEHDGGSSHDRTVSHDGAASGESAPKV